MGDTNRNHELSRIVRMLNRGTPDDDARRQIATALKVNGFNQTVDEFIEDFQEHPRNPVVQRLAAAAILYTEV